MLSIASYFGSSLPGPGDLIASMLGPAVISFGLQLYLYRSMLINNFVKVLATTIFSSIFGLFSSAALARFVGFASFDAALAPLTRCITTPLALAGSKLTGADSSLTALLVVLTGVLGASLSEKILARLEIKDPLSVGLAVGASSHGIGTATLANEPLKFSASVVSMSLTGLWTVALLSNNALRNILKIIAKPV